MQYMSRLKLEYGKNYGSKNDIWKMLAPDKFKPDCTRGWQNHHRPITIFRQNNHKLVFIDESNINKDGKNQIDFEKGTWVSTKLGVNKKYSNKDFYSFLFVVDKDGNGTYRGVWHHEPHNDIEIETLWSRDFERTVFINR